MIGLTITLLSLYIAIGVLFAIPFVLRGAARIDPVTRDSTKGFRLVFLPGCVLLWPVLATKWVRA